MAPEHLLQRRLLAVAATAIALLAAAACQQQAAPDPAAQEPRPAVEARASVDRAVATTGDVVTYTVTVDHDPAYEVDLPEPGAEIAGFRIIDVGRSDPRVEEGREIQELWYELRADLVGSYVLPPVRVNCWRQGSEKPAELEAVSTSEIFVEVESVLPSDGQATDIRDIKPLRHPASRIPWLWIAGGVVLLSAVAAAVVLLRRRSRMEAPPTPPHELAFAALDALRGTDFDDPEAVRRFYFAISQTLRFYVEGRWGLNATDLTSEEIIAGLDQVLDLADTQERELERFLLDTDQVKFAKHQPRQEEIEGTYERALGFVEATRPPEVSSSPAEAS